MVPNNLFRPDFCSFCKRYFFLKPRCAEHSFRFPFKRTICTFYHEADTIHKSYLNLYTTF